MTPRTLVVTPTYNERESLPKMVARVRTAVPHAHILVVDDGSPDGTATWVREKTQQDPHLHLLARTQKTGLGPAYVAGFTWALEHGFEVVCEMDADCSHRPEQLPRLLEESDGGADVVIGSRWVRGGAVHNWPLHREALSRGANLYTQMALGLDVHDATAGFRAYRADVLRELLAAGDIASQGYCFQVDMTRRAAARGFSIREVPIDFDEREHGVSKMSLAIVREAMTRVTIWGAFLRARQLRGLLWSETKKGTSP